MIDKSIINSILNKISSSEVFVSSKSDQELLKYLVHAYLEKIDVTETDIAFAVFGKNKNFNPAEDSSVRTHTYHLRKKLELYYLKEGKNDKCRLVIPKGHYNVKFIEKSSLQKLKINKNNSRVYIITSLVIIFAAITTWGVHRTIFTNNLVKSYNLFKKNNLVWSDFLKSDLPTLIVVGDYYVFQKPHTNSSREQFIRDVEINSDKEFEKYLTNNPAEKGKITKSSISYLGKEVPKCIWTISNVFKGSDKTVDIRLASDIQSEDLSENNIIFIGHFKTLKLIEYFFDDLRFKVQLFPHKVYYTPNYSDTLETISLVSYYRYGFHDDYAIIAKLPGGYNNIIMLITSFSAFGKIEATKELVEPGLINSLLEKNFKASKNYPFYFEAMFKIHGVEHTGFRRDLLHIHEINPEKLLENRSKRTNQTASIPK